MYKQITKNIETALTAGVGHLTRQPSCVFYPHVLSDLSYINIWLKIAFKWHVCTWNLGILLAFWQTY